MRTQRGEDRRQYSEERQGLHKNKRTPRGRIADNAASKGREPDAI